MKIKSTLIIVGAIVGILIAMQFRSYAGVQALLIRDSSSSDALTTIYTLKMASESLKSDISALEEQLEQYSDQTSAYAALIAEIEKNEILVGLKPISGPGVAVTIDAPLSVESMVDLVNELWASGAEAITMNGIRVTDISNGFQTLNDLLLFDGQIIEAPYEFQAIGDSAILEAILSQPGGILTRLNAQYGQEAASIESIDQITMPIAE